MSEDSTVINLPKVYWIHRVKKPLRLSVVTMLIGFGFGIIEYEELTFQTFLIVGGLFLFSWFAYLLYGYYSDCYLIKITGKSIFFETRKNKYKVDNAPKNIRIDYQKYLSHKVIVIGFFDFVPAQRFIGNIRADTLTEEQLIELTNGLNLSVKDESSLKEYISEHK